MPDFQNPKAKALQNEALKLYAQADLAKTESEKTALKARALEKEREADKAENASR